MALGTTPGCKFWLPELQESTFSYAVSSIFVTEVIGSEEFCVCILGHFIIRIDKIKPKYENREIFKLDTRDPERRGKGYFFLMASLLEKAAFLVVVYFHHLRDRKRYPHKQWRGIRTSNPFFRLACDSYF